MLMRTLTIHADFGDGIPPDDVSLKYELQGYPLNPNVEEALEKIWNEEVKKGGSKLSDNPTLNFGGIGNAQISLGPSTFRDYNSTRLLLDGKRKPADYGLVAEDLKFLEKHIDPMSVFPAILLGDYVIMGVKSRQVIGPGAEKVSFPGASYTQRETDTFELDNRTYVKSLPLILERGIKQELDIKGDELKAARVISVAKDDFPGSHRNTGIFSVLETDITSDELAERKSIAEHGWEHSQYMLVPLDQELLEAYIKSDINGLNKPLPEEYAREIIGFGDKKYIDTTGKSQYMLFLLARDRFGTDVFNGLLEKHKSILHLNTPGKVIR